MTVHAGRRRWKIIRFLAAAGLTALLLVYIIFRPPHSAAIGSIKPYMNFRTVRIEGELVQPGRRLSSGAVFYRIDDGTGRLAVFAPLPKDGRLYRAGSRIRALGSLRAGIGSDKSLQAVAVELLAEPALDHPGGRLASVGPQHEGELVTVRGTVQRLWSPKAGSRAPYKIVLQDSSGRLDVIHWQDPPPTLQVGDAVEAAGRVQVYRGRVELRLSGAVQVLDGPP